MSLRTDPEHSDGRRAAGAQTRQRLIDAATAILASHGEAGLTLRTVSDRAGSNVATVKYHFGSREGLVDEVITRATQSVVGAQLAALDALLGTEASPPADALIRAWATPLVHVSISRDKSDRQLGRIISQGLASPDSPMAIKIRNAADAPNQRLQAGLARALPHLGTPELTLRLALMASAVSGFATGAFEPLIAESEPARDLQTRVLDRLVVITTA